MVNAHGGYGAVQVRVGEHIHFRNIISLGGGATLRIETDAHETTGNRAPRSVTRISDISGYNIKCKNGNAALMIQPWGIDNGWFDVEKIEATSCMATVRIDRAYVDMDAAHIGSFNENSRIRDITSIYGTNAQVKNGNFKSVPCRFRYLISDTALEGMENKFYAGPTIAPVLYNASNAVADDPRYYKIDIPSENDIAEKASNFPENALTISRWNNTKDNCSGDISIVPVNALRISPSELSLSIGKSADLIKTIMPSNATNQGVSWVSEDENVAIVNQWGKVTGIALGSTIISVNTTDGNIVKTVAIHVVETNLSNQSVKKRSGSIFPNPTNKKDDLTLLVPENTAKINTVIYDIHGKVVFDKTYKNPSNKIQIESSQLDLTHGLYFISILSDTKFFSTKLIVSD